MPEQNLNPDALDVLATVVFSCPLEDWNEHDEDEKRQLLAPYTRIIDTYLSALPAQPDTVNSVLVDFINDRPGYITALKNTTGNDSTGDYWRWSGHAEARRQLATKLGWTVPHNSGETTRPVEG